MSPSSALAFAVRLLPLLSVFTLAVPGRAHDAPGEYFFGADPGLGLATPLVASSPPPALLGHTSVNIPSSAVPGSQLVLGLRFRDSAGRWGQTSIERIHVIKNASAGSVEWTWGGSFSSVQAATPGEGGAFTIQRPASTMVGAVPNRLLLRPLSGGLAGAATSWIVSPIGSSLPDRIFYAIDRSPDPISAASLPLTGDHLVSAAPLSVAIGNLAPGFHTLHLQVHDRLGVRTDATTFFHVIPGAFQAITGLAYSFVDERNSSQATAFLVVPILASDEAHEFSVPVPDSLAKGFYDVVLRLATASGATGFASTTEIELRTSYGAWANGRFSDLAIEAADVLADPDGDKVVNLLEFAFGLDPRVAEIASPYALSVAGLPVGTRVTAVYRQREGGVGLTGYDYTADGLRYTIEASSDLQAWRPFDEMSGLSAEHTRTTNGDGTETVNFTLAVDPVLAAEGRIFVRLNVSVVP